MMHVSNLILATYSTVLIDGIGVTIWACFPHHQAMCSTTFTCLHCTDTDLTKPGSNPAAQCTAVLLAFKVIQLNLAASRLANR